MSPVWGHLAGVITLLLMLTFIGIWIWAWSGHHKRVFKRMAEIPLDELDDHTDAQGTRINQTSETTPQQPASHTNERHAAVKKEQS